MSNEPHPRVCWLPALPDEGWASMDRYWFELHRCVSEGQGKAFSIQSPIWLGAPPSRSAQSPTLTRFWRKRVVYPLRTSFEQADIFHLLDHSYAHLIPHLPRGSKVVATVFDLVPLEVSDGMSAAQVKRFRRGVENLTCADHLISISEETKRKLNRLLGIPLERVTVAVPGMDFHRFQTPVSKDHPLLQKLTSLPRIIFSVGSAISRKNLQSLPSIFDAMREDFSNGSCCFVRAGELVSPELRRQIIAITGEHGFVELGPLFGDDLIAVFQTARVLIFPSTLEGLTFVIPEAMAGGCPVVTNTMTANPEAGGDAALYYEEGDSNAAAQQLRRLLFDDATHQDHQRRSIERARSMTWNRHMETVLDVYQALLQDSRIPS